MGKNKESWQRKEIRRKAQIAKRASPDHDTYREIVEQIVICEELGRPLSETQIVECAHLSSIQMENRLRAHKVACA